MRVAGIVCISAVTLSAAPAQQPSPSAAFEVSSVKPNKSEADPSFNISPGGSVVITNVPLMNVIINAYSIPAFRIMGAPDWIRRERFDISATRGNNAGAAQTSVMLQALLAERFRLRAHRETREQPVYALVVARNDRQLGPRLKPSTSNCATAAGPTAAAATGPDAA